MVVEVEMDRRMLDYCVGLDTEFGELVEAADMYSPTVSLAQVSLAHSATQLAEPRGTEPPRLTYPRRADWPLLLLRCRPSRARVPWPKPW